MMDSQWGEILVQTANNHVQLVQAQAAAIRLLAAMRAAGVVDDGEPEDALTVGPAVVMDYAAGYFEAFEGKA